MTTETIDRAHDPVAQLLIKLARKRETRTRARIARQAYEVPNNLLIAVMRAVLQLCAFGALTVAGFSLNFLAGMIVLALSLFVISWLVTPTSRNAPQSTVPIGR